MAVPPLHRCLLLLAATACLTAGAQTVVPRALARGDRVALVSPSSVPDSTYVRQACVQLRRWGLEPVVGPHALSDYHGFAGTADERAGDLLWALRDSTVRAVICTRGGDGAVQVLSRVGLDELRRHPKWVVGFSDVTALHSALVQAGVASIHATMCEGIAHRSPTDTVIVALRQLLQGRMPAYTVPPHPLNQCGTARGILVGGNMSVFCGLAGSDFDFFNRADEGLILFIEDTGESMTKVDRMLHLLEVRGVLQKLRGIVVGNFSNYKHPANGFDDMNAMLHEYLSHYDIPVCYGFPVGHGLKQNFPLPEGVTATLRVLPTGVTLTF